MVFPGRFSTGCERCRKRKVKCDEAKPGCRRCCVYGKPCPGYSDTFRFRNANSSSAASSASAASKGSKASKASKASKSSEPLILTFQSVSGRSTEASSVQSSSPDKTVSSLPSPTLTQRVDSSYEQVSLSYFVNRFVTPYYINDFPGFLSFIPDLYNDREHGVLELATLSVANMAAYNQFGSQKFLQQSYRDYGRALQAMREAISVEEKALDDRTLGGAILLSTFMDLKGGEVVGAPAHVSGLYYLLSKRGPEQLATKLGFELFFVAVIQLYAHAILNNDHTYTQINGMIEMLAFYDPLMRALALVSTVLSVRHALSTQPEASQTCGGDRVQVNEELVKEAFEALDAFDQWDQSAGSEWKRTFDWRSEPMPVGKAVYGGYHFDMQTAGTMVLLRSSRLILLMGLMDYFERLALEDVKEFHDPEGGWAACITQIEKDMAMTIDDMLYFVPYVIGDLDVDGNRTTVIYDGAGALLILQSVRLVSICRYANPAQSAEAKAVLQRMNSAMGVRSAVSRVEVEKLWTKMGVQRAADSPMRKFLMTFEEQSREVKQEPLDSATGVGAADQT